MYRVQSEFVFGLHQIEFAILMISFLFRNTHAHLMCVFLCYFYCRYAGYRIYLVFMKLHQIILLHMSAGYEIWLKMCFYLHA